MNFSTGFFKDECKVFYECNVEDDKDNNNFERPEIRLISSEPYNFKTSFFVFLYVYSGSLTINHCGKIIKIPEKTAFVCSPDFPLSFVKTRTNTEVVSIELHASVVNTFEKSEGLSRIFYADEIYKRIYTPEMHKDNIIEPLFNSLKACVLQHYPEPFVLSRIVTIITELNTIFDRFFGEDKKEIPNVAARVFDYIDRHYTENLTIDMICEKFGISPSSVHRICKKAFKKSFKEHIASLRLREARALIIKKDYMPSSVAKIVGYKSYSSFFRAYKKEFGISPMDDVKSKQRWPLV